MITSSDRKGKFTENEKVFAMKISKVYPLRVKKAEQKGRTRDQVNEVICCLTGYTVDDLICQIEKDVDYETLFREAPHLNPNCHLIIGSI